MATKKKVTSKSIKAPGEKKLTPMQQALKEKDPAKKSKLALYLESPDRVIFDIVDMRAVLR